MPIVHHVPGRVRLNLPALKRNEGHAERVRACLSVMDGIKELKVNGLTGSIVIHYDHDANIAEAIVSNLRSEGLLSAETRIPAGLSKASGRWKLPVSAVGGSVGKRVGKKVVDILVEKAVQRSAVALIGALL